MSSTGGGSRSGRNARPRQVYQIDFTAVASGKRIASTKRRVRWRFGFANMEALANGQTGTACRGEEHDITLVWSISSGKRLVLADGQEVHYSNNRNNIFDFSWTMRGNHILKIVAYAAPPLSVTPGFRQYDFFIDGQSFFSFPKVYRLGMNPNDPRLTASPRSPTRLAESSRRRGDPGSKDNIAAIEAPNNPDEEEAYLQEAIRQSLKDSPEKKKAPSRQEPGKGADLLDFVSTTDSSPPVLPLATGSSSDLFSAQSVAGLPQLTTSDPFGGTQSVPGLSTSNPYSAASADPWTNPGAFANQGSYEQQKPALLALPTPAPIPSQPSYSVGSSPAWAAQSSSDPFGATTSTISNGYGQPSSFAPVSTGQYNPASSNPTPLGDAKATGTLVAAGSYRASQQSSSWGAPAPSLNGYYGAPSPPENSWALAPSPATSAWGSTPAPTAATLGSSTGAPTTSWTAPAPIATNQAYAPQGIYGPLASDVPPAVTPQTQQTPSSLGFGSPPADFSGFSPAPVDYHDQTTVAPEPAPAPYGNNFMSQQPNPYDSKPAPSSALDNAFSKLVNMDDMSFGASKKDAARANPFESASSNSIVGGQSLSEIKSKTFKPAAPKEIMRTPAPGALVVSSNQNTNYASQYGVQPTQSQPLYGQAPSMQQSLYGQQGPPMQQPQQQAIYGQQASYGQQPGMDQYGQSAYVQQAPAYGQQPMQQTQYGLQPMQQHQQPQYGQQQQHYGQYPATQQSYY